MAIYVDRVLETSTTTGTGNITLAGAVTGFRTFSSVVALNSFVYYCIEAVDGSGNPTGDWEVGTGYLSASTTLVRSEVESSSNAGALVNFAAGTKRVFATAPAYEMQTKGDIAARTMGWANY